MRLARQALVLATFVLATLLGGVRAQAEAELQRGAKVTFVSSSEQHEQVAVRSRLLALAVERGETPHPVLPVGMFRAKFAAKVVLSTRDRYQFRAEGRGSLALSINGQPVFSGTMRQQKGLQSEAEVRLKKGVNLLELEFSSGSFGDGSFRLLWSSSSFGMEPLPPDLLQWDAVDAELQAGEQLRAGHQSFVALRCANCHAPSALSVGESAYSELASPGPDLRQVGGRLRQDWMAQWILEPKRWHAQASMPKVPLQDEAEAHDLAAYLATQGTPLAAEVGTADEQAVGERRFRELGCVACHAGALASDAVALADRIDLAQVAAKWHKSGLIEFLRAPQKHYERNRMPDFRLTPEDAVALATFLLAKPAAALPQSRGDAGAGRSLAQQRQCTACHQLDVELKQPHPAKQLGHLDAMAGCLSDGASAQRGAPEYGLSREQREALRTFLPLAEQVPFRRAPLDFAARHLHSERCTACHGLDGQASAWAQWSREASATAPLPHAEDPIAQGVPSLTWVGEKLQPSWLTAFVTGELPSPRPWLHARMPSFHAFGAPTITGLVRAHGYLQDEKSAGTNAQQAIYGERLVNMGTGFGCVACHAVGDKPPVQVFEREGINLLTARQRLRHEYYTRWLADPPRIDPDSRMPKYADDKGKSAFVDVLGGDAPAQFEAIWQFLGSRAR